ncbi:ABC transporter permease [Bryobacter aggregatus]|uniref:ABC transporter permease n=1 Tax=Bryobacter aggregatus TaxID=360054 RepID=UPI0004E280E9|nr:ABC transporter permease [Bryobacter aggregatus]
MNRSVTWTVYRKELTELLRDRRTLISMVLLPMVVFPLLFGVVGRFMGEAEKKAATEATTVAIVAGSIPEVFLAPIAKSGLQRVEVPDVASAVANKTAATGLSVSADQKSLTIYAEGTRQASGMAADKLRSALSEYRDSLVVEKLREVKLDASVLTPFTVKRENVASERKMGGFMLGSILGYVVILLMFSGGMYPAIDMTAGEKERKTIETLLASPARRTDIVLAKILACVTATYLTAVLTTTSLFLSLKRGGGTMKGMEKMVGNVPTDVSTIGLVLLTLLPVAVMAGALMISIALRARSFKEAQSYLTPLIMLAIFPSLLGGLPGMELSPALSLVPIFNASQLLKSILQGDVPLVSFAITNLANLSYAVLCFALAVRIFNNEKVLFRT